MLKSMLMYPGLSHNFHKFEKQIIYFTLQTINYSVGFFIFLKCWHSFSQTELLILRIIIKYFFNRRRIKELSNIVSTCRNANYEECVTE